MEVKEKIKSNLKAIRLIMDRSIIDTDIISVQNKLMDLVQVVSLSAECKASSRKLLEEKRLVNLKICENDSLPASILMKKIDAMCSDELALFEYADRINAGLTHILDALRSVISLYKVELENNMK